MDMSTPVHPVATPLSVSFSAVLDLLERHFQPMKFSLLKLSLFNFILLMESKRGTRIRNMSEEFSIYKFLHVREQSLLMPGGGGGGRYLEGPPKVLELRRGAAKINV